MGVPLEAEPVPEVEAVPDEAELPADAEAPLVAVLGLPDEPPEPLDEPWFEPEESPPPSVPAPPTGAGELQPATLNTSAATAEQLAHVVWFIRIPLSLEWDRTGNADSHSERASLGLTTI